VFIAHDPGGAEANDHVHVGFSVDIASQRHDLDGSAERTLPNHLPYSRSVFSFAIPDLLSLKSNRGTGWLRKRRQT
jgi:hypothetical protein